MATPLFLDVFSIYLGGNLSEVLKDAVLENWKLDIDMRNLTVAVKSSTYINRENRLNIQNALKNALKLEDCEISYTFSEDAFCEDACLDLTDQLKLKNAVLNGYFNGAEYALFGKTSLIM